MRPLLISSTKLLLLSALHKTKHNNMPIPIIILYVLILSITTCHTFQQHQQRYYFHSRSNHHKIIKQQQSFDVINQHKSLIEIIHSLCQSKNNNDLLLVKNEEDDDDMTITKTNRRYIFESVKLITTLLLPFPLITNAITTTTTTTLNSETTSNTINCLSDLPKLDTINYIRLYLCRHGETENNRLRIMQGARIDAPINDYGIKQATLLGQALLYATPNNEPPPTIFFHSPMIRAVQTATIAMNQYPISSSLLQPSLYPLSTLKELDFGKLIEQTSVDEMREQRVNIYNAWGMGKLNERMIDDGESGNEILERIDNALDTMIDVAILSKTNSIVAIAHSVYIRVLLSYIHPTSILQIANLPQSNCCINVIDLPRNTKQFTKKRSAKGFLSNNIMSSMNKQHAHILRINETRHLNALV